MGSTTMGSGLDLIPEILRIPVQSQELTLNCGTLDCAVAFSCAHGVDDPQQALGPGRARPCRIPIVPQVGALDAYPYPGLIPSPYVPLSTLCRHPRGCQTHDSGPVVGG